MKILQRFGKGVSESRLRISLCDLKADMTEAWINNFAGLENVEILQGKLMDTDADAVVAPVNSFGDMSGGVDKHIDDYYKGAAQKAISARIRADFLGELPVGMAIIVSIENTHIPTIIASPTMRIPGDAANTVNAYLAMRAVLVAVYQHNRQSKTPILTLAIPGLCTGVGRMPCSIAAHQMRTAYDNIVGEGWIHVVHPAMAPYALKGKSIDWRHF